MKSIYLLLLGVGIFSYINAKELPEPVIWLKADGNVSGNVWHDETGNGYHAGSNKVLMPGKYINYNPSISFKNQNDSLWVNYNVSDKLFLFTYIVFKNDSVGKENKIWGTTGASHHKLLITNTNINDEFNTFQYEFGKSLLPVLTGTCKTWDKINTNDVIPLFIGGGLHVDSLSNIFTGDIAEFIVFDESLSMEEKGAVESYLALKYGIGILETDYYSSAGNIVWDRAINSDYNTGIFGIGRDDGYGLNQKQANNTYGYMSISVGEFKETNSDNKHEWGNMSFLIFSNNGKSPAEDDTGWQDEQESLLFNTCLWKASIYGSDVKNTPTTIKVNRYELFADSISPFCLVQDIKSDGKFSSVNTYIPDSINSNGDAYFSNIKWGNNGSEDYFTFALHSELIAECSFAQPLCSGTSGIAQIDIERGVPPYSIQFIADADTLLTIFSSDSQFRIDSLLQSDFNIKIQDSLGHRYSFSPDTINSPATLITNIDEVYYLEDSSMTITLDNIEYYTIDSIFWLHEGQVLSDSAIVQITEEGSYLLQLKTKQGCPYIQNFYTVDMQNKDLDENLNSIDDEEGSLVLVADKKLELYPNPATNGKFHIKSYNSSLTEYTVHVRNIYGNILYSKNYFAKNEHIFCDYIGVPGVYLISVVKNGTEIFTTKLVVK